MKRLLEKLFGRGRAQPAEPRNKALWSIGLYAGASPLALEPFPGAPNPIVTRDHVTDVPAALVADPFLMPVNGIWHLFFEVLNRDNRRGEIALATSRDLVAWRYEGVVLAEPFHMSYPHVFEWMGTCYMVPETRATNEIRLYKADPFPTRWTLAHTLVRGRAFADSTLFRHGDAWWLFTETNADVKFDTLRLYHADELLGEWTEHPASPVVDGDRRSARPAGRVVSVDGRLLRFAQVCAPRYGVAVNAFEIEELTASSYRERAVDPHPILGGSGAGWNASRMHHVDAHQIAPDRWIAAVDGACDVTASEIWTPSDR